MIQSVATDEHGNYRLYWLAPGAYYVAAVYEDQQRRTINPDPIPPGRRGPTDRATSPVLLRTHTPDGGLIEETYAVVYNGSVTDPSQSARELTVSALSPGVLIRPLPSGVRGTRMHDAPDLRVVLHRRTVAAGEWRVSAARWGAIVAHPVHGSERPRHRAGVV